MAAISPSSSGVPPTSQSQVTPIEQPIANQTKANPPSSLAQSPLPNTPLSNNSSNPSPVSSPPPAPSAPPLSSPPTSPPTNATPPLPPPPPEVSTEPPVSSPPPPLPPPTAPLISPPPPLTLSTPPTSFTSPPPPPQSSSPPPVSSPTPPSSNPPNFPPPPTPLPNPPTISPPPPQSSTPPENSRPPPSSPNPPRAPTAPEPPQSSPSPPVARPPRESPPSGSHFTPPPSVTPPVPPAPVSHVTPSPPSRGSQSTVSSPPVFPSNNSRLDTPPQTANSGTSSTGGIGSGGVAAIGGVVGVLLLGLIGLVALWMFKRKKRRSGANGGHVIPASGGSSPRSDAKLFVKTEYPTSLFGASSSDTPTEHGGYGHSRAWFTYQELFEATSGFSDQNLLGEGGFGRVYKGLLPDGRVIAVKQLKIGASQGEREFKAEVEIIGRIHHRHLVSLVGYCVSESKRLLVYEYVPNNTLHFHLHGEGGADLDWAKRVKIAAGAARGIAYLHEDCHPRIIHRDIKSSNILLDTNFEAWVSDFGLAKLAMDADTHVSTRVMGTFGYMAPEYATSGKLTEKSDVYSFGVVLLELITGRRPVDESQPIGDESLVQWARPLLTHALDTGELGGLVDPRLENKYIESEIYLLIEAAAACVRHSAAKRPRMGQVVRAFDSISDSGDLSNGLRVGESLLYDSAQQSAEIRWFRRMAFGSQGISTDFFSQPTHNPGFSTQSGHNGNFCVHQEQSGNFSRQPSQDAQNLGFSGKSGQNVNFSTRHGQSSNFSRQPSQEAQNLGFSGQSGQNVNISSRHGQSANFSRQPSQEAQNLGFPGPSGQNVNFSTHHGQSGNFQRQQSVDAQNPGFSSTSRQNVYSSAQHDFDGDISS